MAIIKCKLCGGDIELLSDKTFGTCEYCGSTTTLPKISDEQRAAAFNRGNHFRRIGEFDKALAVYERIVREDDTDAEAHWCCALCRFGIEYVEDPTTYEWFPTCHRASFDSFLEDVDYKAALEYSEGLTHRQYLKDGAKIAEVQRGILATSSSAEPFDVFICYKESDAYGNRTRDSIMAQDIYYQLTEHGHRVFFSRITLEDVVGTQYEPYIFAALNSAKVMVVVGTSFENLNAVWVKNEWSRFLAMMKKDRNKVILPCYKDMDPYDLPEQLSILQSYDMGKIGFIQDLIRGIVKILDAEKNTKPGADVPVGLPTISSNVAALLERGNLALEDSEWKKADDFFEEVLNQDAHCAHAYLGKLLAELKLHKADELKHCGKMFWENNTYRKVARFANATLQQQMEEYITHINEQITHMKEQRVFQEIYEKAISMTSGPVAMSDLERMYGIKPKNLVKSEDFLRAAELMQSISGYKDADEYAAEFQKKAKEREMADVYESAIHEAWKATVESQEEAIKLFGTIIDYKDSRERIQQCRQKLEEYREAVHLQEMKKCRQAYQEQNRCQYCGGNFKGVFVKVCGKCGKQKDY